MSKYIHQMLVLKIEMSHKCHYTVGEFQLISHQSECWTSLVWLVNSQLTTYIYFELSMGSYQEEMRTTTPKKKEELTEDIEEIWASMTRRC